MSLTNSSRNFWKFRLSPDCSWSLDYSEADQDSTGQTTSEAQKNLTFYELDLGLNHVSRKWSEQVDNGANMLAMVPGGGDGPSGDLVCVENFVIYKNQEHPDVRATEYGDIFKVTLDHETDKVKELKIKYFDTIPVTSSMYVLKSGYFFAASEFGNHVLYQFQAIGEEVDMEASSATLLETEEGFQPVFFQPRGLKNLVRIDQVESLMPIMDMKVSNLVGVVLAHH
ncbi:SPLICING FACTOR 3B SUBUNIT 3 [Salix purpurea]|uniref:SPLICING FACTOR 3B SUBUNIT 3 n=1 Tax=Salix purpurea TaxID=77065 RepID=A0A9Q0TU75_SALPP|nr:SPLICING FACTOR 3B SUBUNIT 3 [Salix purpurea]